MAGTGIGQKCGRDGNGTGPERETVWYFVPDRDFSIIPVHGCCSHRLPSRRNVYCSRRKCLRSRCLLPSQLLPVPLPDQLFPSLPDVRKQFLPFHVSILGQLCPVHLQPDLSCSYHMTIMGMQLLYPDGLAYATLGTTTERRLLDVWALLLDELFLGITFLLFLLSFAGMLHEYFPRLFKIKNEKFVFLSDIFSNTTIVFRFRKIIKGGGGTVRCQLSAVSFEF